MVKSVLLAICLASMAASVALYNDWRRQRDELLELLQQAGFEAGNESVIDRVRHERSGHHARIATARAFVYEVLNARPATSAPTAGAALEAATELEIATPEWDAAVSRLAVAARLARQALDVQPSSWEAAMLQGAAIYLERSIRRDPRLYTSYRDWEDPLVQASREAPGQAEPRRFLAAAYLEVWPALSPEKREITREMLREAFANDPQAFSLLSSIWLDVTESLDEAFEVIPKRADAWRTLEQLFAERRDWDAFCQAHARRLEALLEVNQARIAEAEERLRLGELFHSRSLLLQTVAGSPLDLRFSPLISRALELYPPGLHGLASTEPLRAWLRWALELDGYGIEALPASVISRLASTAGQLERPEQALAALIGGEIYHAESFESSADSLSSQPWGAYLLAKARWHLKRDQSGLAASTLELVDRATRRSVHYALARLEVARARGDLVEQAEAERALDAFRSRDWSAADWQWNGYRASLPILGSGRARGLRLGLNGVSDDGAVVEIRWDGHVAALRPIVADGELELELPVAAGLHLLELRIVAGQQLFPGRVSLLGP